MEASLVGVVGYGLQLTLGVGIGVLSADYHHVLRLVIFVEDFLQLTGLIPFDTVFSLEAVEG